MPVSIDGVYGGPSWLEGEGGPEQSLLRDGSPVLGTSSAGTSRLSAWCARRRKEACTMHVLLFALLVGGNTILWSVDDVLYTRLGNNKPPTFPPAPTR